MAMQSNKYTQYVRFCFIPGDIRASKIPVTQTNTSTTSPVRQQTVWLEATTKLNQAAT